MSAEKEKNDGAVWALCLALVLFIPVIVSLTGEDLSNVYFMYLRFPATLGLIYISYKTFKSKFTMFGILPLSVAAGMSVIFYNLIVLIPFPTQISLAICIFSGFVAIKYWSSSIEANPHTKNVNLASSEKKSPLPMRDGNTFKGNSLTETFARKGFYRLWVNLLGLAKVKSVTFYPDQVSLNFKGWKKSIEYEKINKVRTTGIFFKKISFNSGKHWAGVSGLSSSDAKRLYSAYENAATESFLRKFQRLSPEINDTLRWIEEVHARTFYLRSSIYKARIQKAKTCVEYFSERIPKKLNQSPEILQIEKIRSFLEDTDSHRLENNKEYLPIELDRNAKLFDQIENNPLTEEQRKSVVVDEDANLVVAAAGSGKTSVIVAKVAWLLSKRLRDAKEILLLAFASDARSEMSQRLKERIPNLAENAISVHTFHSLGKEILEQTIGVKQSVSKLAEDKVALHNFISAAIRSNLEDKHYRDLLNKWFTEFFAPYESEFDFENYGQYWSYIKKHNIRSLKGELVKSFEECEIANFLYTQGIDYIYEADYEHKTSDNRRRQYQPDFYLPDYKIYIEHLGLKGFGRTAPFVDRKEYLQSLRWKRELHKHHETTLIETYSCEKSQGVLTSRLKEKLEEKGVVFDQIDPEKIFDLLREKGRLDPFTSLVTTFLGHFKGSHLTETILRSRNANLNEKSQARNAAFIDVFMPVFNSYQEHLLAENKIDFHDMISLACEQLENGKYQSPFRYIMVDEFQDISIGRSKLVSALQKYDDDTQLFCVGDDWQAIFRFAGSDINLMKEFGSFFGNFERTDLSITFRSEEKITKQATNFILQNKDQISKEVSSFRRHDDPSVHVCFQNADGEKYLSDILQQIADEKDSDDTAEVLILGRYNLKTYSKDYAQVLSDLRGQFPNLKINFKTAHRSKGLEADYVIILEVIEDFLGFPNERADDHVLEMVLAQAENFPNSEERRLFYVALTRAKKKVFVCTESGKMSPFVNELIQSPYQCEIWGKPPSALPQCTKCVEGKLNLKTGPHGNFWSCNNFPYCEHTEQPCPHCKQGYPDVWSKNELKCDFCEQLISSCPRQDCDGHLQQELGPYGPFWGCSKFRDTGCDYKTKHLSSAIPITPRGNNETSIPLSKIGKQTLNKQKQKVTDKTAQSRITERLIPSNENIGELRKTVKNAYKPWSDVEEQRLRQLVASGETVRSIADIMGRQVGAIRSRMDKLGL